MVKLSKKNTFGSIGNCMCLVKSCLYKQTSLKQFANFGSHLLATLERNL